MTTDRHAEDAAANRFLLELIADREAGRVRSLEEYQASYPGFEERLAAEHARVARGVAAPTSSVDALHAGARVGPYRLVDELGRGGQGSVWRAEDTRLGRTVALKLISAASWLPDAVARFQREANLASRLQHPGLCTVFEADGHAGVPYVAMQLVAGETLHARLARAREDGERPPPLEVARYVEEAARALHVAHEAGIVHRDAKPANLMITPEGKVVVLDFGIAREVDVEGGTITLSGELYGTPTYLAPEQLQGRRPDRGADVWALGVTLYEALHLEPPFRAPTREALYRAILEQEPQPPRGANGARLPRDLEVIVATALAKEPERRYATALDLADDLAALRAGRSIRARPVGPLGRLARWARREPGRAALVAGLAVALLAATGLTAFLAARRGQLEAGARLFSEQERERLVRDLAQGVIDGPEVELLLGELIRGDPRMTAQRAAFIEHLARAGRGDEAYALYTTAPDDTDDPRALDRAWAAALWTLGRTDEARALEEELGEPRSELECYYASVAAALDLAPSSRRRALDLCRRAIFLTPGVSENYLVRYVELAFAERDWEQAQLAARALERHHAHSGLAALFIAMAWSHDDIDRSREWMERAVELEAPLPMVHAMVAQYYDMEGDYDRGRTAFEQGVAAATEGTKGWHDLFVIRLVNCLQLERYDEAAETAERALAVEPDSAELHVFFARALRGLGLTPESERALERALELEPENTEARALVFGE